MISLFRPGVLLLAVGVALGSSAQIAFGGKPYGKAAEKRGLPVAPIVEFPGPKAWLAQELADEQAREAAGQIGPARFGHEHEADLSTENSGVWHLMANGDRVWRLRLDCPEALAVNLILSRYIVPDGARLFVYNGAGEIHGGYTAQSNPGHEVLGIAPMRGDHLTLEYIVPSSCASLGGITVGKVIHAFRDPFLSQRKDFGDSGPCHFNVICPEGDDWRPQIRSVARIIAGGGYCTGQLLNNCSNDTTPYFISANHCLLAPDPPSTWVFQFNWDSPVCTPNTLPLIEDNTISGATQLATNAGTDMLFLELNSIPPPDYNCYYSGWDKTDVQPVGVTCIHHPSGDIKKISGDSGACPPINIDVGNGPADCWHVQSWEYGVTEPGSSGSGIWKNSGGKFVGQLYGGASACGLPTDDYYGRFDLSYPVIEQWLGSCGDTLNGFDPLIGISPDMDAAITSIYDIPENVCNQDFVAPMVTLKNNGAGELYYVTINWEVIGGANGSVDWNGTLQPLQTVNLELDPIPVSDGPQQLYIYTSAPNGVVDQNPANDGLYFNMLVNDPGQLITLTLNLDQFGTETNWQLFTSNNELITEGGPYLDSDTGYTVLHDFCLGNGCYIFSITDDFGDGICCGQYGNGNYTISDPWNTYVESDGTFGEGETMLFCVQGASVDEITGAQGNIWPNPATDELHVSMERPFGEQARYSIVDAVGRSILTGALPSMATNVDMDLRHLTAGAYVLVLDGNELQARYPLVLRR